MLFRTAHSIVGRIAVSGIRPGLAELDDSSLLDPTPDEMLVDMAELMLLLGHGSRKLGRRRCCFVRICTRIILLRPLQA
jgi:hypothetical protein